MRKIGIFGGSFDPIHKSHIKVIKNSIKQLELDTLLVIPTKENPWKEMSYATSEQKKAMIEIALKKIKKAKLETIELDSPHSGKNFTIDTINQLKEKYQDSEFYLIMGMDQASDFHKWYQCDLIARKCQLVCFDRLGYETNLNIDKFDFITLDIEPTSISSSDVRDGHIEFLQKSVLRYISKEGLYLDTMIKPRMTKRRYEHTLSVAKLAKEIAMANGLDSKKAYIAAILHDVTKELPRSIEKEIMEKEYAAKMSLPHVVWHQYSGEYIAREEFLVEDKEVLQAIRYHTTADENMSKLDMVIYVADKLDPLRDYDSTAQIELAKQDIEAGFANCLKDFYEFSKQKNRKIDKVFFGIYKKYIGDFNE